MDDLTAYLLGRSLGNNIGRQREQERQERERQHNEMMAALNRRPARKNKGPGVLACNGCGGMLSFGAAQRGKRGNCPHCGKSLYLWENAD